MCLCVCYWPPVHEVCTNHEVVMFQPRTETPPKPRLRHLLVHSLIFEPAPSPPPSIRCLSRGAQRIPDPPPHPPTSTFSPNEIIFPPRYHPSLYQHTDNTLPSPHPSLSESGSSYPTYPSPHLLDSCQRRSLAATKISSNMALRCFSAAICCHHGTQRLPSLS